MTPAEFIEWAVRVFGSVESYRKALPARRWERTANGWASAPRGSTKEVE